MKRSGGRYDPALQRTLKLGKFSSFLFHHSIPHSFPLTSSPLSSPDIPVLFLPPRPLPISLTLHLIAFFFLCSHHLGRLHYSPACQSVKRALCTLLLYCVLIRQFAANFASGVFSNRLAFLFSPLRTAPTPSPSRVIYPVKHHGPRQHHLLRFSSFRIEVDHPMVCSASQSFGSMADNSSWGWLGKSGITLFMNVTRRTRRRRRRPASSFWTSQVGVSVL
jgi:hypothetical protein